MGELATFAAGRMTAGEYRKERERIAALLKGTQATAHADQELAALFARSGWTQEELAKVEGKTQQWVDYRVRFGQFLEFTTAVVKPEFAPIQATLTEGRFRRYWLLTSGSNQRQRFLAVQQLLLQARDSHGQRKGVGDAVAQLADGEYHKVSTFVEHVKAVDQEATEADVCAVLDGMATSSNNGQKVGWYGVICQRRKGASLQFKVWRPSRAITLDVDTLKRELDPIIEGLKVEGRKNIVTASPGTVQSLAFQLERLIESLVNQQPPSGGTAPQE